MWKVPLFTVLLTTLAFAGCTSYQEEDRPVDFSQVDERQDGVEKPFTLHVAVVGAGNGTPIPDAFVGAVSGSQAIAKSTTDATGHATLYVANDQAIRLVAKAKTWTTEDTGYIVLGDAIPPVNPPNFCLVLCVQPALPPPTLYLAGHEGSVSVILYHTDLQQVLTVRAGPHVNLYATTLPDGRQWLATRERVEGDFHAQYMARLTRVDGELTWTNNLLNQADFEFGIGCDADSPAAQTDGGWGQTYLTQQGKVTVQLTYDRSEPTQFAPGRSCKFAHAGPLVDTLNSEMEAKVNLDLHFVGHSKILPMNP